MMMILKWALVNWIAVIIRHVIIGGVVVIVVVIAVAGVGGEGEEEAAVEAVGAEAGGGGGGDGFNYKAAVTAVGPHVVGLGERGERGRERC